MSILPIVQRQHLRARLRPLCYFFGFAVLLAVGFWFQSPNEHLRGRMLDDGSLYPKGIFTKEQKEKGVILLDIIGVCYMFIALAVVCDEFFVPTLEVIVERLDISNDVAGATFMAAGGSAPEFFTSMLGTFVSKSNVGFGTIIGSAVFNVLFVIGMCAFFSKEVLELTWWPLARDVTYYSISLIMLALFFGVISPELIEWWEALVLLLMYIGYGCIMKYNVVLQQWANRKVGVAAVSPERENSPSPTSDPTPAPLQRNGSASFRAGVFGILVSNKSILDTAAVHIVSKIKGDVKATFDEIDRTKDGKIDRNELKDLFLSLHGNPPTEQDIDDAFRKLDTDKDGFISLEEFKPWYTESETRLKAESLKAFDVIDTDQDGMISRIELRRLILTIGLEATEDELDEAFGELDKTKDGKIDKSDFVEWYERSMFFDKRKTLAQQEMEEDEGLKLEWPSTTRARMMYIFMAPIMFSLYYTLPDVRKPGKEKYFIISFAGSVSWIAFYSYFMVWWATNIGEVFGLSPEVMGLTFLAAGTSIPDLLTSVIVARQGEGDMAVSSSIGSNIFDVLLGLPTPWLLYTIIFGKPLSVVSDTLFVSVLVLFAMLLAVIIVIVWNKWRMTKQLGVTMIILYAVFVAQDLIRGLNT